MSAINLTIDGQEIEVAPGTTILEAARQLGINIPTFCHDPELAPNGACRICVVEVEKAKALVASCVAPAGPGMVVYTESERVVSARKKILSLILANHPLDCITCEKTGQCKLQDYCYRYDVTTSEFVGEMKELPFDDTNAFFLRDMNKCILCGICVGKCQDVVGAGAIDFTNRGFVTNVGPSFEDSIEDSTCVFCGMCIDNCPVGALIPKYGIGKGRPWEVELVPAICPYCGVGCNINLHVKDGEIIGATPDKENPVNRGHLCAKGKFGWDHVHSADRITAPLIKSDGVFIEVSWEEALDYIVDNIEEIQARFGSESLMGLGSPKASNEDNYLFQKLIRSLGSNNIDSYTRHCHTPAVKGLMETFGSAAMSNSIEEITAADAVLVVDTNPAEEYPIIEYRLREAVKNGARLIVADSEPIELLTAAQSFLEMEPGTSVALVNGLANIIISEDLYDKDFVEKRTEGYDQLKEAVKAFTPAYVAEVTGVPEPDLTAAARTYAAAEKGVIISSAASDSGEADLVLALANLALLTGNLGKESAGLYLPYSENNLQGSADMGVLPGRLTGYQSLDDKTAREKFEKAWNVKLNENAGLSALEAIKKGKDSPIKVLYVMGENPVACGGDKDSLADFLDNLDFMIVQDIFMTETAALADVVLPAAAFAEKTGTYTNIERRVQISQPAVEPPGEVFPDWAILNELAEWLGLDWDYAGAEDIFNEMTSLTPDYQGLSYDRLLEGGIQWPCSAEDHPGTAYLYADNFPVGKAKFNTVKFNKPLSVAAKEGGHHNSCQCLSGTMSKRSVLENLKKYACCS